MFTTSCTFKGIIPEIPNYKPKLEELRSMLIQIDICLYPLFDYDSNLRTQNLLHAYVNLYSLMRSSLVSTLPSLFPWMKALSSTPSLSSPLPIYLCTYPKTYCITSSLFLIKTDLIVKFENYSYHRCKWWRFLLYEILIHLCVNKNISVNIYIDVVTFVTEKWDPFHRNVIKIVHVHFNFLVCANIWSQHCTQQISQSCASQYDENCLHK